MQIYIINILITYVIKPLFLDKIKRFSYTNQSIYFREYGNSAQIRQ